MSTLQVQDGFEPYVAGREPFEKLSKKQAEAGKKKPRAAQERSSTPPSDIAAMPEGDETD